MSLTTSLFNLKKNGVTAEKLTDQLIESNEAGDIGGGSGLIYTGNYSAPPPSSSILRISDLNLTAQNGLGVEKNIKNFVWLASDGFFPGPTPSNIISTGLFYSNNITIVSAISANIINEPSVVGDEVYVNFSSVLGANFIDQVLVYRDGGDSQIKVQVFYNGGSGGQQLVGYKVQFWFVDNE